MRSFCWLLSCAAWLLLPGCGASRQERQADMAVMDYMAGDYARARRRLEPLSQKTDENYVLNNVRLGSSPSPSTTWTPPRRLSFARTKSSTARA